MSRNAHFSQAKFFTKELVDILDMEMQAIHAIERSGEDLDPLNDTPIINLTRGAQTDRNMLRTSTIIAERICLPLDPGSQNIVRYSVHRWY